MSKRAHSSTTWPLDGNVSWSCNERVVFTQSHVWQIDQFKDRITDTAPGDKLKSKDFSVQIQDKDGNPKRLNFGLRAALNGVFLDEPNNPGQGQGDQQQQQQQQQQQPPMERREQYKEFVGIMLRNKNNETISLKFAVCLLDIRGQVHWRSYEPRPGQIKANHGKWFRRAFKKTQILAKEQEYLVDSHQLNIQVQCCSPLKRPSRFIGQFFQSPRIAQGNLSLNLPG